MVFLGMPKPSDRVAAVQMPIIPRVADWIRAHPGTLSLGQGVAGYAPPPEAWTEMERLRGIAIPHPRSSVSPLLTISMGTATVVPNDDATLFDLIQAADEALYRAKEAGRDRAEHSAELLAAV